MTHSFSSHVTVPPDVLFRLIGGEAVLLNLKTEQYLGLDAVGTEMWVTLTNTSSIQAAYDTLLQEYEVGPGRLKQDMERFLNKLIAHGLIVVRSGEGALAEGQP